MGSSVTSRARFLSTSVYEMISPGYFSKPEDVTFNPLPIFSQVTPPSQADN